MVGEYMFPLKNPGATVGSIPQLPSDPKDVVKEHTVTPVTAAGCTAGPLIPSWYAAWGADGRGPKAPGSCFFLLCIAEVVLEKDAVNLLIWLKFGIIMW